MAEGRRGGKKGRREGRSWVRKPKPELKEKIARKWVHYVQEF